MYMIADGGVATSGAGGAFAKAGPIYATARLLIETARHRNRETTTAAMQD